MNNKKLNIEIYLKNLNEEFLNKSEPLRKEIKQNIKDLVKCYSNEQIIEVIKQCTLDNEHKEYLFNSFKSNTLIFLDWIILAKLIQTNKNKSIPLSTLDILKSVGILALVKMFRELAEEYNQNFSIDVSRQLLSPDYKFDIITLDGREVIDLTKDPFPEYFNLTFDFKNKILEYFSKFLDSFFYESLKIN